MEDRSLLAIQTHLRALPAPVYEVGILHKGQMLLRKWDAHGVLKSSGFLRARNANGADIYIRPHGEHRYSLLDDLQPAKLPVLKQQGFSPALVIETSPGNLQAWLDHGRVLPKEVSTAVARELASRFECDTGSADWRHFGRLAGLTNRKPKHQDRETGHYPFVKLIEAQPGLVYPQAAEFVSSIERARENDQIEAARKKGKRERFSGRGQGRTEANLKTIDDFHRDQRYAGDLSRADLAYAVYALGHSQSEAAIENAIRQRDLSFKGNQARVDDYVRRTIVKAAEAVLSMPKLTQPDRVKELSR